MKLMVRDVIRPVAAGLLALFALCSCTTIVSPRYPETWPKLVSVSGVGQLSGSYDNRSDGHTMASTADVADRPLLAHVLGLKYDLGAAAFVSIKAAPESALAITFYDRAGQKIETVTLGRPQGWEWETGRFVNREASGGAGDSGGGRYRIERALYQAEDGSLIVQTHVISTVGLAFATQTKDEMQWTRFRPLALNSPPRPSQPKQRRPPVVTMAMKGAVR
jgi:hypothetical protein